MRSVILYIAMSLDGYIADREGGVDWLAGQEPGQDSRTATTPCWSESTPCFWGGTPTTS